MSIATPGLTIPGPMMVIFDSGEADLTRIARELLDYQAAQHPAFGEDNYLVVQGHTDTRGSSEANLELSCRRAEVARDYLIAKGVPAQSIVVEGLGESRPLVDTGDEVTEPQNRRVEVLVMPGRPSPQQRLTCRL